MLPKHWREQTGISLAELARRLGVAGKNPARTYQRYETGERAAPAAIIQRFREISHDAVRAEDWHEARLAWLDRVAQSRPAPAEAAE